MMAPELSARGKKTTFQVSGITCMDCAAKFEQAVNALPGVMKASLNTITGRLTVEGAADLAAIRRLGRQENYTINLIGPVRSAKITAVKNMDWNLYRAVLSGVCLAAAYSVEKFSGLVAVFLPLYIVAIVLGGWGNFTKAVRALQHFKFNMSVLMSVAVLGAVAIGRYEEGASVSFLFTISEMLEAWNMEKARRSLRELMDLTPKTARVRRPGGEVEIPVESIAVGDVVLVRPGEKIAVDGVILTGQSAVNQSTITGEAIPAEKGPGDLVYAGTLNTYGSLTIGVTKLVHDTTIARIIAMVQEAEDKRAPSQAFVEKFAAVYTPIVIALAIGIAVIPPLLGYAWYPWFYRGLALLMVACPCALVISTPVAIVSAISTAAKNGVLIKGGIYLEAAGSLNAVALDKTGTLTKGEPVVTDVIAVTSLGKDEVLAMAANLEAGSEHPLAQAIVKAAQGRGYAVKSVEDFTAITGRGGCGTIDGKVMYIGSPRLFCEMGVSLQPVVREIEQLEGQGKTVMLVGTRDTIMGIIAVADEVRESSAAAIAALKRVGIRNTIMLTGDNAATAKAMAARIGVDAYRAELLPQDKVAAVEELLGQYRHVAMVGDGINDAPALARATVGIAMGGAGTDTALETADIVLMADDLRMLPFTIRLSRKARQIIRQNVAFALGIKLLAVLAVFPGWLTLWLAIVADMGAAIMVTLNSLRLLRVKAAA